MSVRTAIVAAWVAVLSCASAGAATDAEQKALAAIEADPGSEASFVSIKKLMNSVSARAWPPAGEDLALLRRLAQVLLQHQAGHADVANAAMIYVFAVPPAEQTAYMRRLYDATPLKDERSGLAAQLVNTYERWAHDPATTPAVRSQIRKDMKEFVAQVRKDFADDAFRLKHAEGGLASLDYSVGNRLPEAEWPLIDGKGQVKVADYRGRILIVDIWATWCPPCVAGQPGLLAFTEEMRGRPLEVITLSMDKNPADVVEHQKKQRMPWVNAYIGFQAPLLKTIGITGFPTYFVLDEQGVIRARVGEFDDATKDYVRALVAGLK